MTETVRFFLTLAKSDGFGEDKNRYYANCTTQLSEHPQASGQDLVSVSDWPLDGVPFPTRTVCLPVDTTRETGLIIKASLFVVRYQSDQSFRLNMGVLTTRVSIVDLFDSVHTVVPNVTSK